MNAPSNTIAAANAASFPIPYPGHQPGDDLYRAVRMIELAVDALSMDRAIGPNFATTISVSLTSALDILGPIALLLDHADRPDDGNLYLHCRRQDTIVKMGNGSAS